MPEKYLLSKYRMKFTHLAVLCRVSSLAGRMLNGDLCGTQDRYEDSRFVPWGQQSLSFQTTRYVDRQFNISSSVLRQK